MTGRKRKKSPSSEMKPEERERLENRLEKLQRHQEVYRRRGHDNTPVDAEIKRIERQLKSGGQIEPLEDK